MRTTNKNTQSVTIEFTRAEAEWLRDLTQNYLGYGEERPDHAELREALFCALTYEQPSTKSAFEDDVPY